MVILVIYTFDTHIYTTHRLNMEMDHRREKEGVVILVIYTFDTHIYTTHRLKMEMNQKAGMVIRSHLYI